MYKYVKSSEVFDDYDDEIEAEIDTNAPVMASCFGMTEEELGESLDRAAESEGMTFDELIKLLETRGVI